MVLFLTDLLHGALARDLPFARQAPLCLLLVLLGWALATSWRLGDQWGRKYYLYAEIVVGLICLLLMTY